MHTVQLRKHCVFAEFSIELQKTMREDLKSLDFINEYAIFERQMIDGFQSAQSVKNLREGNFKKSFIYLLIDPRVAENLLADSQVCPIAYKLCDIAPPAIRA